MPTTTVTRDHVSNPFLAEALDKCVQYTKEPENVSLTRLQIPFQFCFSTQWNGTNLKRYFLLFKMLPITILQEKQKQPGSQSQFPPHDFTSQELDKMVHHM